MSIKDYEKRLLNNLESEVSTEAPLKNIRKELGSIAYVPGNPLTKTEITLNIRTQFFDDFTSAPVLPAALPPALQTVVPVFLFGLTDFHGGYLKSKVLSKVVQNVLSVNTWNMPGVQVRAGVQQQSVGIFGYNTGDNIAAQFGAFIAGSYQIGDLMMILFSPSGGASGTWCIITVHCENVAYGTFLNSFVSDLITIDTIRYIVPIASVAQFINPLTFGYQTLFGKFSTDSIDPRMYITNKDFQQQIADIPINLPIDKAMLLNMQISFFCQTFSLVLFVKKVEQLTHKQ
jgi:hypothetical protein